MLIDLACPTLFNSAMMKLKIHKCELPIQEIKTATELDLSNKGLNFMDAIVIAALLPLNRYIRQILSYTHSIGSNVLPWSTAP